MMLNLSFVVGHALSIRNRIIGGFKSSKLIIVAANSYWAFTKYIILKSISVLAYLFLIKIQYGSMVPILKMGKLRYRQN